MVQKENEVIADSGSLDNTTDRIQRPILKGEAVAIQSGLIAVL